MLAVVAAVVDPVAATVVEAVVAAVVPAAVVAVAATAVALFEVLVDAPAAMQPVRIAAVVTPARPLTRLARRAGCGRRRRGADRTGAVGTGGGSAVPFVLSCFRLSMMFMG